MAFDKDVAAQHQMVQPDQINDQEENQDRFLRPRSFDEFVGQEKVASNLKLYIAAAKERREAMDHVLLSGMPGLGKTTLAYLIAREMGGNFSSTSGPCLESPQDLLGLLTKLAPGDVLFIDEIHRLNSKLEEYLYSAMEDGVVDLVIDKGPNARSVRLPLENFTLVGATTREGLLTDPFRARFGVLEKLMPYPPEILADIIMRSAEKMAVPIDRDSALLLGNRSRGTPRIANRFLRRIRDLAQVSGESSINQATVLAGLERLGVDEHGLDSTDRRIITVIAAQAGVPVGLKTIAVALGEEERTIEEVYEPYLIQKGYLLKTPRGRLITPDGEAVLNSGPALT